MLAERRPFPPGVSSNPWRYAPADGEVDLQFSMTAALLGVVLAGAYLGWLLARPVPLLPGWIGAIGGAAVLGYSATLRDRRGDMLRYLGHCLGACATVVSRTQQDARLGEKLSVLMGRVLFLSKTLDSKYGILTRLQLIIALVISKISILISRFETSIFVLFLSCAFGVV